MERCTALVPLLVTASPDEIILGGQDPGVYVHTAATVARRGFLVMDEPGPARARG